MPMTRRSVLGAGASSVVATAATAFAQEVSATEEAVAELVRRSEEANAALMRGDVDHYLSLISLGDDFTLMSPFGGPTSRGPYDDAAWREIGRFFRNGTLRQKLVQAYSSPDMVVLAIVEHGHGEVGGLPAQDWPLRVTLVYRRDGTEWRLVHRHADPLVRGIGLEEAAVLAAGAA